MRKGSYYIGIIFLIFSISFVIHQYKKESDNESAIAKVANLENTNNLNHEEKLNLLSNRDMDLIQIDGFEHENMSRIGQLREQFTLSLHMAYIGIHSLSKLDDNKKRTFKNNEETYNRVITELENALKTLNSNTEMSNKLEQLITKASTSKVENTEIIDELYKEIHYIDNLYNKSLPSIDKSETNQSVENEKLSTEVWLNSMIDRVGSHNPYAYATQDDFDYYTAKYIRDYLKTNMYDGKENMIVKVEKSRNIAEQLMKASPEERKQLTNMLKDSLKLLK